MHTITAKNLSKEKSDLSIHPTKRGQPSISRTVLLTLYCFVRSWTVCPSLAWVEVEQAEAGQRHCRSSHGVPYVSSLPHTEKGEHTGSSDSLLYK